jgi:hypothetical protein
MRRARREFAGLSIAAFQQNKAIHMGNIILVNALRMVLV